MTFEDFDLHPRILAGLGDLASQPLTAVQELALPPIMEGQDVLVLCPPGDGKSAVMVLPLLQHTLFGPRGRIQGLILTPTQELTEKIYSEIEHFGQHTRVRSLALYGGQISAQLEMLRDGVEIVVACPAALIEHLNRGTVDLSRVGMLVLEELDRLCDMGFLPDLWRILKVTPQQRQTLLFSATDNDELRKLSQTLLRAPTTIQVGEVMPTAPVAHIIYPVAAEFKAEALLALLEMGELPSKTLLIFCETRFRAKRLGEKLKHAGYATALLTDELSPKRRNIAIEGFREGIFGILVTTDAAAQGLNVTGISHVINFDMPAAATTYLHRAGRAAHGNNGGVALSLLTPDDRELWDAITLQLDTRPERRSLPDDFD